MFHSHFHYGHCRRLFSTSWILTASLAAVTLLGACSKNTDSSGIPGDKPLIADKPLLRLLDAKDTGIDFANTIKVTFDLNLTNNVNNSNGGGVAIFDANNDSLPDIYFIASTGINKFYVNKGDMKFEDITQKAGLESDGGFEMTVTTADVNADGYLDIYICRGGPKPTDERRNRLYINNHDLTFTEQAKRYGLDDISASSGANFFDYDLDGDLDLYLLNYPEDFGYTNRIMVQPNKDSTAVEPILTPQSPYDSDRLYRNDGPPKDDGTGGFTDVSKAAGIWNFGYGLSVTVEDFNEDGWPDVYVANDFIQPDRLYINQKDGTFSDRLKDFMQHTTQHTMGIDLADMDNDGLFDLFAADMLTHTQYRRKTIVTTNNQNKYSALMQNNYFPPVVRNTLQHNNGNQTFSDIACMANVYQTEWSWSGLLVDLDNDSWKDLVVTNGYQFETADMDFLNFKFQDIKAKGSIEDQFANIDEFLKLIPQYKTNDFVFRNTGNLVFEDKSGVWMTELPTWSNGAAYGDLDHDGDMDYVVSNLDEPAFVYENLATKENGNHYLQIVCQGPAQNPFGIGTSVTLYYDSVKQYQYLNPTKGIYSSMEPMLHFGLGTLTMIDSAVVVWPDGMSQTLTELKANQRISITYPEASRRYLRKLNAPGMYRNLTSSGVLPFTHVENPYVDFENTFLLPWALSDLGPLMSVADINKDGLTDVFIGNSFGKSSGLYVQKSNGTFELNDRALWVSDTLYEAHGSHFFDADMDGDMDLLIINGGYESISPQAWQIRLFINIGPNQFKEAKGAIPLLEGVSLRAISYDYDADGDIDLIIGGRVLPGKYPLAPASYILRNDRNRFVDVTAEVAPEFSRIGMITDLQIANIDDDAAPELIVVGEWMPVTVFKIQNGKFSLTEGKKYGFEYSNGFWNRLLVTDFDKDGDLDLLTGNLGMNSNYRASVESPIQVYASDFDGNGSIDPVITYFEGTTCYPLVQKDALIKQIPILKKKFVYYKDYASASIEDVFTPKQLKSATVLSTYMVESGWWQNDHGRFTFHAFPIQAQASPVNSIVVDDLDEDGFPELFVAGNKYHMEVETGRLDAGIGSYFEIGPKGSLQYVPNVKTGLWASKDVRDVAVLHGNDGQKTILVANNNDVLQVYRLQH